jgi:Ca2+-binding EF-hand superfamily protein
LTLNEFIFLIGAIKVMTICVYLFEAADTDASGVLESSEIKNVLTKLHENAGVDPPSDKDMDAMIKSVGGELTLEQFASVVIPLIIEAAGDPVITSKNQKRGILSKETKEYIGELFAAADADESGTIDAGEIHAVMGKIAKKEGFTAPSKEQIQARLDGLPTENEGKSMVMVWYC